MRQAQTSKYVNAGTVTYDLNACWAEVRVAPPVEAVLQPFADGAEVSGVCHHGAVQRVVLQVDW